MTGRVVTITGGSGFVGQILRGGLRARGYRVEVFDRFKGRIVNHLRRHYLGTSHRVPKLRAARYIHRAQRRLEPRLANSGLLRPTRDDILDLRSRIAERFRASYAVIHLAALPHANVPGAVDADYRRINYEGSVNVFEAARLAGVPRFIFASSAQVYGINNPPRIDRFPILESNYCPTLEDGQSLYGALKREFEMYLARACGEGATQSLALRLEYPGIRSRTPRNFYISTSIENLIAGFICALEAPLSPAFDVFNLADGHVDEAIADVQEFVRREWPDVPNHSQGNESLLSVAKAREVLEYRPLRGGSYIHSSLAWDTSWTGVR